MNRKLAIFISCLLTMMIFMSMLPANASPAVNGKLSLSNSYYVEGTPVYITTYDLDSSTAYYINITVGSTTTTYGSWTTNSDADPFTMIWTAQNTGSSNVVTIVLCSPLSSAVDTVSITVDDVDSLLPTDLIVTIGISIFIIAIIAGIVIRKRF